MHMADSLISPVVGVSMLAVSTGAIAYSIAKTKDELTEKKIPLMGVMGAFIFAAQMINFSIPATGSSGHIGGGILLAALLGQFPAFLVISSVLIIQALFFADGGLLALGCNIFNMGFFSCFIAYPLFFKPIIKKGLNNKTITIAAVLSVIVGLQLGAFSVVLETLFSGVTQLPFYNFLALMQPIHLAIGLVEGIVTASILCFIYKVRPEILEESSFNINKTKDFSVKKLVIGFIIATILVGGGFSLLASSYPDGLEWSISKISNQEIQTDNYNIHKIIEDIQSKTAIMPDYGFKNKQHNSTIGTSTSGIVGGAITLIFGLFLGFIILLIKKRRKNRTDF